MTTNEMQKLQDRKAIEIAWAAHLDTCMDPECATCAEYERAIYHG